jgi:hypothetical protein
MARIVLGKVVAALKEPGNWAVCISDKAARNVNTDGAMLQQQGRMSGMRRAGRTAQTPV